MFENFREMVGNLRKIAKCRRYLHVLYLTKCHCYQFSYCNHCVVLSHQPNSSPYSAIPIAGTRMSQGARRSAGRTSVVHTASACSVTGCPCRGLTRSLTVLSSFFIVIRDFGLRKHDARKGFFKT